MGGETAHSKQRGGTHHSAVADFFMLAHERVERKGEDAIASGRLRVQRNTVLDPALPDLVL